MADREPPDDASLVPGFLQGPRGRWHSPAPDGPLEATDAAVGPPAAGPARGNPEPIDPASLPVALSRRRLAIIAGGLVMILVLVGFGRQVSDAAAASARAAQLRAINASLQSDLANLQHDTGWAGDQAYQGIAARGYGLGVKPEIPFVLAADAPTLAPDAPGSAAVRLGAPPARSPLDAWVDLLLGTGR